MKTKTSIKIIILSSMVATMVVSVDTISDGSGIVYFLFV